MGWCIECGGKALERFSSDAEPGLLDQQLLGGQTSRLQHEVGAGEARGAYGILSVWGRNIENSVNVNRNAAFPFDCRS